MPAFYQEIFDLAEQQDAGGGWWWCIEVYRLSREAGSLQLLKDRIDKGQVSPKVRLFHQLEVDRLDGGDQCRGGAHAPQERHGLRGAGAATRLRLAALLLPIPLSRSRLGLVGAVGTDLALCAAHGASSRRGDPALSSQRAPLGLLGPFWAA